MTKRKKDKKTTNKRQTAGWIFYTKIWEHRFQSEITEDITTLNWNYEDMESDNTTTPQKTEDEIKWTTEIRSSRYMCGVEPVELLLLKTR